MTTPERCQKRLGTCPPKAAGETKQSSNSQARAHAWTTHLLSPERTRHPRNTRLHGSGGGGGVEDRNYSGKSISAMGQNFCCSRVSNDRIVKTFSPLFPTKVFSVGIERDSPAAGHPHAWLWHALGTCCQTQAVPGPSALSLDGAGKRYGCYKSQIPPRHIVQDLTSASCGQQRKSLRAAK